MKAVSVGILVTNGRVFLAGHSTGNRFYDLPKGLPEAGETPAQTAIRELQEETGLTADPELLLDLGVMPYLRNKDLHLFVWQLPELPDLAQLVCTSTFIHRYTGKPVPEIDGYLYVDYNEAASFMTANMARILAAVQAMLDPNK